MNLSSLDLARSVRLGQFTLRALSCKLIKNVVHLHVVEQFMDFQDRGQADVIDVILGLDVTKPSLLKEKQLIATEMEDTKREYSRTGFESPFDKYETFRARHRLSFRRRLCLIPPLYWNDIERLYQEWRDGVSTLDELRFSSTRASSQLHVADLNLTVNSIFEPQSLCGGTQTRETITGDLKLIIPLNGRVPDLKNTARMRRFKMALSRTVVLRV
ncbi:hypothetical protein BT69DRAFT_1318467 [Atractiella rhizophila]|nr:hypothetical protein BT69DRAFT_1318467 [Atractiella rhizophila]